MFFITSLCFKELLVRQFRCVRHSLFFAGNSWLNCRIIESIFNMSLVYLHTCTLVQSFMSRTFAALNSPYSNFRLVTSKIGYFEFCYLEFFEKDREFFASWMTWEQANLHTRKLFLCTFILVLQTEQDLKSLKNFILSNRLQVSVVYKLINHEGCW